MLVLVGSGISIGATRGHAQQGAASWTGLLESALDRVLTERLLDADEVAQQRRSLAQPNVQVLLSAATAIEQALKRSSRGSYQKFLADSLGSLEPVHPEVLDAIIGLNAPLLTTNYDSLLELRANLQPLTWRDQRNVERLFAGDRAGVLHLHGHWSEPESVVLGLPSYDEVTRDRYTQDRLRRLFLDYTLLLVGCGESGLGDPNLGALFDWARRNCGLLQHDHFLLGTASQVRDMRARHTTSEGIDFVSYGASHGDLLPFLQELSAGLRPTREPGPAGTTERGSTRPSLPGPQSAASRRDLSPAQLKRLDTMRLERAELRQRGAPTKSLDEQIAAIKRASRPSPSLGVEDVLAGRYEIIDPAGRGGFAKVYKALDRQTGDIVAVKILFPHLCEEPRSVERFERGARNMLRLNHPHIVRVIEHPTQEEGRHYFVMEFLSAGNLEQAILTGQLSRTQALKALLEVGDALAYAHSQGIIHRDVTPRNILLDHSHRAKLTDFDLVRAADTSGGTGTGAMGTATYAAPEQMIDSGSADSRADVYSLGMTAVFILLGPRLTPVLVWNHDRLLEELDCDEPLKRVLRRATAHALDQRYPSMDMFCAELRTAIMPSSGTLSEVASENIPLPKSRRKWVLSGTAAALLVMTAFLGSNAYRQMRWSARRDAEQRTAVLLLQIQADMKDRRWEDVLRAGRWIKELNALPAEQESSVQQSIARANLELQAQQEYERFDAALRKNDDDSAVAMYQRLPVSSIYAVEGRAAFDNAVKRFIRTHLQAAVSAANRHDCTALREQAATIDRLDSDYHDLLASLASNCDASGQKAAVGTASSPAVAALSTAQRLNDEGKHTKAMRAVDYALDEGKLSVEQQQTALLILGRAACQLKDREQATRAYRRLDPEGRQLVHDVCAQQGVNNIPDARAELAGQTLVDATRAYRNGDFGTAARLAREGLVASPITAWRILGLTACATHNQAAVKEALEHLDLLGQKAVRAACQHQKDTLAPPTEAAR